MQTDNRVAIIANRRAGHGRAAGLVSDLHQILRSRGVEYRFLETEAPGHATELARDLALEGESRIVVMGGDGTIAEAVNGMLGSGSVLGLIPVGTGNDLARSLGIPANDVAGAVEILLTNHQRAIDIGWERDRHFILMTAIGLPVLVAEEANRMKRLKGSLAFFLSVYKALRRMERLEVVLTLDETRIELECNSILVQNTPYCGGGQWMAPAASLEDGVLDVVVVRPLGKLNLMVNFPKVYTGRHIEHPSFSILQARSVRIESPVRLRKMFDGDVYGETPVEARALRQALTVISPPVKR